MANQASRDSTQLPFVRNNRGWRLSNFLSKFEGSRCAIYAEYISVRKFPFGLTRLWSRSNAPKSVARIAFVRCIFRIPHANGGSCRRARGYIPGWWSKSMNRIFMGGLKISRAAGRAPAATRTVVRNFFFVCDIYLYLLRGASDGVKNHEQRESASYRRHLSFFPAASLPLGRKRISWVFSL